MKLELKSLWSPDTGMDNLERPTLKDPENFYVLIQVLIGPIKSEGCESFEFLVCSPKWFESQLKKEKFILPRHHIVMKKFDIKLIRRVLNDLLKQCSRDTWNESAQCLSRFAKWEFENYKKYGDRAFE